jgi:uncharacterized protein (DUF433 family)
MRLEDYFEAITPDEIRLKGHRINIEHIVERYQAGMTPEQIAADLPSLTLEQVYGALTYYLHNRTQVDDYLRRLNDFVEEQVRAEAAHPLPAADRVRARMAEKQSA